jgi:integrase
MARVSGSRKLSRMSIGRFPAIGLAEARQTARSALEMAATGVDPRSNQGNSAPLILTATATFGNAAEEFLQTYAERRLRSNTIRQYRHTLAGICAAWRSTPVKALSRRDVLGLLDRLEADGKLAMADASYRYLSRFFRWCVERDYLETSPTLGIRRTHKTKSRERVLQHEEIADVWEGLSHMGYPFGPLLQVLLLTGQRRDEVAGMRRDELRDWETNPVWEIPASRTKNARPHIVPIVPAVSEIIDGLPGKGLFVFSTNGIRPVSGFSKAKKRLTKAIGDARTKRGALPDLPDWRFHDFRRSFATHSAERLGYEPHIIEAVINHISGARAGVAGVYNRAAYLDGRRKCLEKWRSS